MILRLLPLRRRRSWSGNKLLLKRSIAARVGPLAAVRAKCQSSDRVSASPFPPRTRDDRNNSVPQERIASLHPVVTLSFRVRPSSSVAGSAIRVMLHLSPCHLMASNIHDIRHATLWSVTEPVALARRSGRAIQQRRESSENPADSKGIVPRRFRTDGGAYSSSGLCDRNLAVSSHDACGASISKSPPVSG